MAMDEDNDDGRIGRGRARREAGRAHRHGEQLVALDPAQVAALALPEPLASELEIARGIRSWRARNRQIGYVDKLLRQLDEEELQRIASFLDDPQAPDRAVDRALDHLLEEGDAAVAALVDARPDLDVQRLRQLVRNARRDRAKGTPGRAERELRRLL